LAVVAILEHVRAAEHVHHNLPVLLTTRERPAQFRMSIQELRPGDDLMSDDRRKFWRLTLKKSCETIKVGERIVRPMQVYWSCHGRNRGVPHVRSQCTTRSCGIVGAPASISFQRRSSSSISFVSTST